MTDTLESLLARNRTRRRLPSPEARKLLRERHGLSQDEVASLVGTNRSTVSRWETGIRDPRGLTLTLYLELLDRLAREPA